IGNLLSNSAKYGAGGESASAFGGNAGTGAGGGSVNLNGTTIKVTATVGSAFNTTPFTTSTFSGSSVIASGVSGGAITMTEPGVSLTSQLFPADMNLTGTSVYGASIGASPTMWINSGT